MEGEREKLGTDLPQHAKTTCLLPAKTTKARPRRASNPLIIKVFFKDYGRGDKIRTCDSYVPNVVLYQAELRPDLNV